MPSFPARSMAIGFKRFSRAGQTPQAKRSTQLKPRLWPTSRSSFWWIRRTSPRWPSSLLPTPPSRFPAKSCQSMATCNETEPGAAPSSAARFAGDCRAAGRRCACHRRHKRSGCAADRGWHCAGPCRDILHAQCVIAQCSIGCRGRLEGFRRPDLGGLACAERNAAEMVAQLNKAVLMTLADPVIKARLEAAVGGEARGSTPAEMHDLVVSEIVKWRALIETAKIPKI